LGLTVNRTRPAANQANPAVTTQTTTQYDAVGRVTGISYNDGSTPVKSFTYDVPSLWTNFSQTNLKGRLSVAYVGASPTIIAGMSFSYDALGRALGSAQCQPSGCGTGSKDKHFTYGYDWNGNLTLTSDGSGVTTSYTRSPAGEVTSIGTSLSGPTYVSTLVSNVQNGPNGPSSYLLGNGLSTSVSYDGLGRLNGKWLCNGSSPSPNCSNQVYGTTANWRGQRLLSSTDSVLASGQYSYDDFNRLSLTNYNGGLYVFNEIYDRYGNRWRQNTIAGTGAQPQLSFDQTTNRVNTAGYAYDAAGNMTNDSFHTYTYDAEGNVVLIDNGQTEKHTYDAFNHRVRVDVPVDANQALEIYFNAFGQRVSMWFPNTGVQYEGNYYWGSTPIAYYSTTGTVF
jgi:YD repeat-containing protein